jgi:hypothetical protein
MKSSTLTLLVGVMVAAVALLLLVNFFSIYLQPDAKRFIKPGEVKGISVFHGEKEFAANSRQQNDIISILNQSVRLKPDMVQKDEKQQIAYSKIVIYRFDQPEIVITPIEVVKNQLIFSCPEWYPEGYMREVGPGNLNAILLSVIK